MQSGIDQYSYEYSDWYSQLSIFVDDMFLQGP